MHLSMCNVPWVIVGDFNVIYNMMERSDYFDGIGMQVAFKEFKECLEVVGFDRYGL